MIYIAPCYFFSTTAQFQESDTAFNQDNFLVRSVLTKWLQDGFSKMVCRSFNKISLRKTSENALADLFEAVMPKMPAHGVLF